MVFEFTESDLPNIAKKLRKQLKAGDVVGFSGQLAAGKTTLIGQLVKAFGYDGRVSSPTFVVEHRYPLKNSPINEIIHLDLYRLNQEDLPSIDWGEYHFQPKTIILIEWPERLSRGLININKHIDLEIINDKKRRLTLQDSTSN